jgi:cellulose synthase/poly-beta-1,6-N-acetylglucosamine synthase-like glycosyltransferase
LPMLDVLAWTLALVLGGALLYFSAEVLLGLKPLDRFGLPAGGSASPDLAVLIPAHNEAAVIGRTLARLEGMLPAGTRTLVVADNCDDDTAAIGRRCGADVVERNDRARHGKGYALAFGRDWLARSPPGAVIVLDADCELAPGSAAALGHTAIECRAAQAVNLQQAYAAASPLVQISNFAILIKNLVRARGVQRIAGGIPLFGTGMAFSWETFAHADLASDHLAEDMQLAIDLGRAGTRARLEEGAFVTSGCAGVADTIQQRRRWEGGFLQIAVSQALPLVAEGIRARSRHLLGLGLHLLVPPLALLFLMALGGLAALLAFGLGGQVWGPFIALLAALTTASAAVFAAWLVAGRRMLPLRSLLLAPAYLAWKLPLYLGFIVTRKGRWTRTRRPGEPATVDASDTRS